MAVTFVYSGAGRMESPDDFGCPLYGTITGTVVPFVDSLEPVPFTPENISKVVGMIGKLDPRGCTFCTSAGPVSLQVTELEKGKRDYSLTPVLTNHEELDLGPYREDDPESTLDLGALLNFLFERYPGMFAYYQLPYTPEPGQLRVLCPSRVSKQFLVTSLRTVTLSSAMWQQVRDMGYDTQKVPADVAFIRCGDRLHAAKIPVFPPTCFPLSTRLERDGHPDLYTVHPLPFENPRTQFLLVNFSRELLRDTPDMPLCEPSGRWLLEPVPTVRQAPRHVDRLDPLIECLRALRVSADGNPLVHTFSDADILMELKYRGCIDALVDQHEVTGRDRTTLLEHVDQENHTVPRFSWRETLANGYAPVPTPPPVGTTLHHFRWKFTEQ